MEIIELQIQTYSNDARLISPSKHQDLWQIHREKETLKLRFGENYYFGFCPHQGVGNIWVWWICCLWVHCRHNHHRKLRKFTTNKRTTGQSRAEGGVPQAGGQQPRWGRMAMAPPSSSWSRGLAVILGWVWSCHGHDGHGCGQFWAFYFWSGDCYLRQRQRL